MNEKAIDQSIDNSVISSKTTESHSRKKSSSKPSTNETETTIKSSEKKRKAPKIHVTKDTTEEENVYETSNNHTVGKENDTQEVPIKSKKKRAPKIEISNENNELISTEQPIKTKKSKAQKPTAPIDDEFQIIETPSVDESASYIEPKSKVKRSKKSKAPPPPPDFDSFEELQVTNLDDINSTTPEFTDAAPYPDDLQLSEGGPSEYEKAIFDSYNNLAAQVDFSQYVGDDQWTIVHLPKSARTEPKSRIRKMLPGQKDEKVTTKKPPVPKGSLFTRIRSSMNTLVNDPNNLIFGERSNYELNDQEEEEEIDTDDLHRYAQKLRELEDQDREINPEFLVLHDGKTVYGIRESDVDGKVKISKRKPIYDRFADQKPDEQSDKKKLLARLKIPFSRNKDKDGKESKSAATTPDIRLQRKSSRKSLNNDLAAATDGEPAMI